MERYSNKRRMFRKGGRFTKPSPSDFGIGGACPNCRHLLIRHYDGDERERPVDPRKFRFRCFTCEPLTQEEIALEAEIEASRPKQKGMLEFLGLEAK